MPDDVGGQRGGPGLLAGLDSAWSRIRDRLADLSEDEYLWEPARDCWSVRSAPGGGWQIERPEPEPARQPVTTIAWRLWHIGSECLAEYTSLGLGPWPLQVRDKEWFAAPGPALEALDQAWEAFRAGLAGLGEDGLWRPVDPAGDARADDPWAGVVLSAQDELAHHGAEIALLRDLYELEAR